MNKELLVKHITEYYKKSQTNKDKYESDLEERREKQKYYQGFNKQKILKMDEDIFYEYISKLWAMIIWGNKKYIVDKIILDNGFDNIKKLLADFLYGENKLDIRWDLFRKFAKNFGSAMASELLTYVYPDKCMLWNRRAYVGLAYLGVEGLPKYDYQLTGKKYLELCNEIKQIALIMQENGFENADMLFVDYFIWDELQSEEPLASIGKKVSDTTKVKEEREIQQDKNEFIHNEIQNKLYNIGIWLGFNCSIEVKIAPGAVVDVIWEATIGNMGRVIYVFEVQTKGSIDSLILNLVKSLSNPAVQGIVAVSDQKQLEKIQNEYDSVTVFSNKQLKLWDYKEVLKNYDALELVNESINTLDLVPDGFYESKK